MKKTRDSKGRFKKGWKERQNFRSFDNARKFTHSLKLSNRKEWKDYCKSGKKPADIPAGPDRVYKNKGWKGMGDWLGTGTVAPGDKKFRSFNEARKFARSLKLKNTDEWEAYVKSGKRPKDIPSGPNKSYKKSSGWKSWGDFLGTGSIATAKRTFTPLKEAKYEARRIAKELGITTKKQWLEAHRTGKITADLPQNPDGFYYLKRKKKK